MPRSRVRPVSLQDVWMQTGHARWMGEPSSSWKKFQRWWRKTTMRTLCLVSTLKGLITRWKQPIAHLEQTSDKLILWQLRDKYHKIIFWYTFLKKKKENPVKINQAQFIFVFFLFFRFNVWALCPKAFTWMASEQDLLTPGNYFWTTSKRQDVAIQRIIPAVMKTVTMKMLLFHSTPKVGVNARRMVITWPVSTKVTAMNLTVLTSSDAVNISWELQMLKTVIILFPTISLYKKETKRKTFFENL